MIQTALSSMWDVLSGQKSASEAQEDADKERQGNTVNEGLLAQFNTCAKNITRQNSDDQIQSRTQGRDSMTA